MKALEDELEEEMKYLNDSIYPRAVGVLPTDKFNAKIRYSRRIQGFRVQDRQNMRLYLPLINDEAVRDNQAKEILKVVDKYYITDFTG